MSKDTGGPAFPNVYEVQAPEGMKKWIIEDGISTRDYFAGKALPGLIAAIMVEECHNWRPADFADEAYKIADAMMQARTK